MSSSCIEFGFLFGSPLRGPLQMSLRTFMHLTLSVIDLGLLFQIILAMAPRHESASAQARGKHPIEPEATTESAHVCEGHQRVRIDMSLFGSPVEHEQYCSDFRQ